MEVKTSSGSFLRSIPRVHALELVCDSFSDTLSAVPEVKLQKRPAPPNSDSPSKGSKNPDTDTVASPSVKVSDDTPLYISRAGRVVRPRKLN